MISFVVNLFLKRIFLTKTIFWKIAFEIVSISITTAVIYYASESFVLNGKFYTLESMSLFAFLLVGEIALVLPMSFAERLLTFFLEICNLEFYQTLVGLRISPIRFILGRVMAEAIFPFIRIVCILVFSYLFLNFNFSLVSLLTFFLMQLFAILIFSFMALIVTLLHKKFNRGIGLFYTLQSVAAILGGVYFPTKIFPHYLKNISSILPQTQILESGRSIFQGQVLNFSNYFNLLIWLILLSGVFYILDIYTVSWQKHKARYF